MQDYNTGWSETHPSFRCEIDKIVRMPKRGSLSESQRGGNLKKEALNICHGLMLVIPCWQKQLYRERMWRKVCHLSTVRRLGSRQGGEYVDTLTNKGEICKDILGQQMSPSESIIAHSVIGSMHLGARNFPDLDGASF